MIYLQITSGRGPVECELAVAKIPGLIAGSLVITDFGKPATIKIVKTTKQSTILGIGGPNARHCADSWIGTVMWVCPSPIRKNHKRKNWFVGVREIQIPGSEDTLIREQDCVWEFKKASSKGGQHANKSATLVRLTHIPTGITVVSEDQRSQKQNKILALGRLREALIQRQQDAIAKLEAENWMQHNQLERGNPIRTFEGPDFVERR